MTSVSNDTANASPRRRPHSSRSQGGRVQRARYNNREFGVRNDALLPPSQSLGRSTGLETMYRGFETVAESLNILAQTNRHRRVVDIDDDIIKTTEKLVSLEDNNIHDGPLHECYKNKLNSLNVEKERATLFDERLARHNNDNV